MAGSRLAAVATAALDDDLPVARWSLLLHSVIAMNEDGMQALEALGTPSVMLVPHPAHLLDAPFYKRRYPQLTVLAPPDAARRLGDRVRVDAEPTHRLPDLGIRVHVAPGMRFTEVVPELPLPNGEVALAFTDLFVAGEPPGSSRAANMLLRLLGPPKGCGVPRLVRFRQVTDRAAVRGFLTQLAETSGLSIITGAHCPPIREGCRDALLRAARTA